MTKKLFCILQIVLAALLLTVSCTKDPGTGNNAMSGWENLGKEDNDPEEPDQPTDPDDRDKPVVEDNHWFKTRGLVFAWSDCERRDILDYIDIAKKTNLNTFSIFGANRNLTNWKDFVAECEENGIYIEYEEHMLSFLLPRDLFNSHPDYFRMNEQGTRVKDANGCPSNPGAIAEVKKNAKTLAKNYEPTNHKYYTWLDDGGGVCHCPQCKDLNAADQSLIFENAIIEAIREIDPEAQLAHLAYYNTTEAPKSVKPAEGIFLEYAPFQRNRYKPLSETWTECPDGHTHADYLRMLSDNLKVFPKSTAQVLEYWMDESLFCGWDPNNLVEVFWNKAYFEDDLKTYAKYGIQHVTCYSAYVGPQYRKQFGYPQFLEDYGNALDKFEK